MINTIDLHIHTNYSDGTDSLKKVLEIATANGLQYISITDHESMEAYKNINLMHNYKLNVIPGLELHTYYDNKEIHLLSYGLEYENTDISEYLKKLRYERTEIAFETVELIRRQGIPLTWEDVLKKSGDDVAVTKGHIINALSDFNLEDKSFYYDFFNPSGSKYLPYKENPFSKAVDIIKSNGGKAVLAHPGLIFDDNLVLDIIKKFDTGLEVYYYYYGKKRNEWIKKYKTMALDYGTIYTGGSDYHGYITESELGGIYVPEAVIEMLLA